MYKGSLKKLREKIDSSKKGNQKICSKLKYKIGDSKKVVSGIDVDLGKSLNFGLDVDLGKKIDLGKRIEI